MVQSPNSHDLQGSRDYIKAKHLEFKQARFKMVTLSYCLCCLAGLFDVEVVSGCVCLKILLLDFTCFFFISASSPFESRITIICLWTKWFDQDVSDQF